MGLASHSSASLGTALGGRTGVDLEAKPEETDLNSRRLPPPEAVVLVGSALLCTAAPSGPDQGHPLTLLGHKKILRCLRADSG